MLAMPALRRPGLLISAALAITVPGVLAIVALLGPEHTATRATAFASAGAGEAATGGGELYDYAETAQDGMGIQLLGESAAAGLAVSYQGVELLAQSGVAGQDTIVSNVWHSGGVTITQTSDAAMATGTQPYVSYDVDNRSPEGVFGVTKTLVSLLGQHYVAVYQGTGSAVGRPALVVELHRADGSLAARFWLDRQTMVPLRREVFDTSARVISEEAFVQVQFGTLTKLPGPTAASAASAKASAKASAGATAATPSGSGWSAVTAPAQLLADLNKQGWRLPVSLPGGLPLYSAARSTTTAGQVLDLGYSDGLSVVSLFVQRGTLAQRPAGWQQVSLPGHQVYVAGHSIIWAGDGFVYTMLADAPPVVVTQVVASLPQNTAPGFFDRIMRGFHRLAAVANPFH
ncbi:MAG TPA: sigma-E factor regulatory protein RseB domain-containing protein [Trebonia sp.]|jgi:sigma-E factor negative regulatory protein RseB|nr:sigma-E factor regulatory protein RseB domain-containing protein [Trebonia sp.]